MNEAAQGLDTPFDAIVTIDWVAQRRAAFDDVLFKFFLKKYWNEEEITTYADKRYSDGNLYEHLGFKYSHDSSPNYWYTKDYFNLIHRANFMKHKLKDKLDSFDENKTEWENMQINGYDRIWDCGNIVFKY